MVTAWTTIILAILMSNDRDLTREEGFFGWAFSASVFALALDISILVYYFYKA